MIGRIVDTDSLRLARQDHVSSLGWLLTPEFLSNELLWIGASGLRGCTGQLLGAELHNVPSTPLPGGIAFVACTEELLPALAAVPLPKLVFAKQSPSEHACAPALLGWIQQ
jgi:hypothetical protein